MRKPYTEHVAPNGQRVLIAPVSGTKAVTVLVLYHVGSRYESPAVNGVSHFVEHLFFKGTTRRPTTLDISKSLDRYGAEYNAFTTKDHTGYYIKIDESHLEDALDILSDMLHHSTFVSEEIDRERNVIVEEISMYEDNPIMYVEDLFEGLLFGTRTPLGQNIAGPRSVIQAVPRAKILAYRDKHYLPSTSLIVVAGKVPSSVRRLVNTFFPARGRKLSRPRFAAYRHRQSAPRATTMFKDTEQAQLALGVPALPYGHRDAGALQLLSTILGGNMSSRLFISIRERRGLAYSIRTSTNAYEDTGVFSVRAGVHRKRLPEALRAILEELAKIRADGVTADELAKAKDYLQGSTTLELEDCEAIASWYGRQRLLIGRIETPEDRLAAIQRVTKSQVARVARTLLHRDRLNLAIIGPYRTAGPFLPILRRFRP